MQQACQFHQVATSLLRSGLLQLVIGRLVETTCNKPVEIINVQVCWQLATSLISTQGKLNNTYLTKTGIEPTFFEMLAEWSTN